MTEGNKAMELLRSLGDFDDPTGPATRIQIETLEAKMRRYGAENPDATFRIHEDGPEQTTAEILEELDAEEAMISTLKKALEQ